MTDAANATAASAPGMFTPFRNRIFLAIWIASLVSNFGALIQGVGASWLMTSIATSASMVTMVAASTALPIVLFSLVAGAAADVWDRRLVMLAAQTLMLLVSGALAVFTWLHLITPWLLLGLTFLLGCGAALNGPAWQSSVGEQVPRGDLPGAVALNALGFNLARAVGPAIGGVVVAAAGPQAAFALNTLTYVGLIVVLARWRRPVPTRDLPPETIPSAVIAGLRYALLSTEIRTVLLRALVFGLFASAISSLLPLIARQRLGGTSLTYGLLLGAFGAGAVGGALLSVRLRARFSNEAVLRGVSILLAASTLCIASSASLPLTLVALLLGGASWVLALSMFNVLVQLSTPRWVVGRAMAVLQMVTFAGFAGGSLGWGLLTQAHGLTVAFAISGIGVGASALLGLWFPVAALRSADATAPAARTGIRGSFDVDPRGGPVVTTIRYRVGPANMSAFAARMWELGRVRRRNGVRGWALLRDVADPAVWVERFESLTWLEHLRELDRGTVADEAVRARVRALHEGDAPPVVRHLLQQSPEGLDLVGAATPTVAATTDPHLPGADGEPAATAAAGPAAPAR